MHAEVTSILGLDVYTERGIFLGRVDDAMLDPEQGVVSGLALGDVNRSIFDLKSGGVIIPYRWVRAVGDIVLVKHFNRHAKDERKDS
jgi:sporulation protein YlmC with PRC-barrel domain